MGGAPGTRIGEGHAVELDRRFEGGHGRGRCWAVFDRGPRVEDGEYLLRRRLAQHAVVQQPAQLAQRTEDLDAHHQYHEQGVEAHDAVGHAVGAERQGRGGAHGDAGIGDAARQRVGRQHPHGAAEQIARLGGQQPGAGAALAERLERRQPLDRVEELGAERAVCVAPCEARLGVPDVEGGGRHQGEQREGDQQRRDRQVEEGDEYEDARRQQNGSGELRQVLAEEGLELLDAVDRRGDHVAGALEPEMGGAELDHLAVEAPANVELNQRRGLVGDHGAQVLEPAAQNHDAGDRGEGLDQRVGACALEDLGQEPAEQRQTGDADGGRDETYQHRAGDTPAHTYGKTPQPSVEIHAASRGTAARDPNMVDRLPSGTAVAGSGQRAMSGAPTAALS